MSRRPPSVFVGNIPYEATEEQLKEKFSEAGPVISFRLVYDRDTGKPKGFGFCEYVDEESARCAMRNLNHTEFGGRILRVDYADNDEKKQDQGSSGATAAGDTPAQMGGSGAAVKPEDAPRVIASVVQGLADDKVTEMLAQLKAYVQAMPEQARYMLIQNPQLAYAVWLCQQRAGLLPKDKADQMLTSDVPSAPEPGPARSDLAASPQPPRAPAMPVPPPGPRPAFPALSMPMPGFPQGPFLGHSPMFGMRPPLATMPMMPPMAHVMTTTPPAQPQLPLQPQVPPQPQLPPQAHPPQQPQVPPQSTSQPPMLVQSQPSQVGLSEDERRRYLELVLSLTPEDLEQLPPEQRESMIILRREAEAMRRR